MSTHEAPGRPDRPAGEAAARKQLEHARALRQAGADRRGVDPEEGERPGAGASSTGGASSNAQVDRGSRRRHRQALGKRRSARGRAARRGVARRALPRSSRRSVSRLKTRCGTCSASQRAEAPSAASAAAARSPRRGLAPSDKRRAWPVARARSAAQLVDAAGSAAALDQAGDRSRPARAHGSAGRRCRPRPGRRSPAGWRAWRTRRALALAGAEHQRRADDGRVDRQAEQGFVGEPLAAQVGRLGLAVALHADAERRDLDDAADAGERRRRGTARSGPAVCMRSKLAPAVGMRMPTQLTTASIVGLAQLRAPSRPASTRLHEVERDRRRRRRRPRGCAAR